ncbi:MAG: helix-turn-helix domain-containing protein, partial [Planctomycetota bacterium]
ALPTSGVDLESLESELVLQAIAVAKDSKSKAVRLLGLNRDQIRYRLEKYGLTEQAEAKE